MKTLDASALIDFLLVPEGFDQHVSILKDNLIAPAILVPEVLNALKKAYLTKRVSRAQANQAARHFASFNITLVTFISIKRNENIFVHGGVSPEFILDGFKIKKVNRIMRKAIDRDQEEMNAIPFFYSKYFGETSPIWYRGYFYDNLDESIIDEVLTKVKAKHFVVGHCSQEEVVQLYNNKIFGVDSSIKNGEYGEVLFIDVNSFSRGTMSGDLIKF